VCSEANFREKLLFMQIFLYFQLFSVKRPNKLGLESGRMRSYQLLVWQVDRPDALITPLDAILTGSYPFLCFLCHPHITAFLLIYHVMLCVCLEDFFRDFGILCKSLLIHDILCVFLYSFKFLCFLEHWNILLIEIFS
jgi:hypothetical protein